MLPSLLPCLPPLPLLESIQNKCFIMQSRSALTLCWKWLQAFFPHLEWSLTLDHDLQSSEALDTFAPSSPLLTKIHPHQPSPTPLERFRYLSRGFCGYGFQCGRWSTRQRQMHNGDLMAQRRPVDLHLILESLFWTYETTGKCEKMTTER